LDYQCKEKTETGAGLVSDKCHKASTQSHPALVWEGETESFAEISICYEEPGNDILYVVLLVEDKTNYGLVFFGKTCKGRRQRDSEILEVVDCFFAYLLFFLTKKVGKKVKANTKAPPVLPGHPPKTLSFFEVVIYLRGKNNFLYVVLLVMETPTTA